MKKHFVNVCLFSVLALGTVACNSDDNAPTEQVNPYKKFKGTWTGSFSGNTQGCNWTATFDTNGKAMGTLTTGNFTFDLEGQVSENGDSRSCQAFSATGWALSLRALMISLARSAGTQ